MNAVHAVKKKKSIKFHNKKKHIQRNRKIVATGILLLSLFIIGNSLKNMYVSYRCSNFLYSVDYYFTHWKNKNLRLIEVESLSVISKIDNTIEIEVVGLAYEKPFKKTYLIGKFTEDNKGRWHMESVKIKNSDTLESDFQNNIEALNEN